MRGLFTIAAIGLLTAGSPLQAAGKDSAGSEGEAVIIACAASDRSDPSCRQVQQPSDLSLALADERPAKRKQITQMPWLIGAFQ